MTGLETACRCPHPGSSILPAHRHASKTVAFFIFSFHSPAIKSKAIKEKQFQRGDWNP